jgi:nicotinate dehydrogenase subunit B
MEMLDGAGHTIHTPNLTPDAATGLGSWTRADLTRALHEGVRRDGSRLRAPMPPFKGLSDDEASALFAFLRTLPARHGTSR